MKGYKARGTNLNRPICLGHGMREMMCPMDSRINFEELAGVDGRLSLSSAIIPRPRVNEFLYAAESHTIYTPLFYTTCLDCLDLKIPDSKPVAIISMTLTTKKLG
jgi:hypothetical protein